MKKIIFLPEIKSYLPSHSHKQCTIMQQASH
uniref:Uncharacterized protein n=1 Tax=Arundo donax TaxID=35708 RepID=A0A0A8YJJ4_ARUDO